jgi:hypothetical protein
MRPSTSQKSLRKGTKQSAAGASFKIRYHEKFKPDIPKMKTNSTASRQDPQMTNTGRNFCKIDSNAGSNTDRPDLE